MAAEYLPGTPGERIRDLRKEAKLNQDEFAEAIGISRSTLGDIELDKRSIPQVLLSEEYYVFDAGVTIESGSCLDINRGFAFNEKANTESRTVALNKLLETNADKIIMECGFNPFSKS